MMNAKAVKTRLHIKPKRFTTIVMMLIIWAGVAGSLFAAISTDINSREYLRGRAQIIGNALPAQDISQLSGSAKDLTSLRYQQLKERLQQIRLANSDLNMVYLVGQRDGKTIYLADSEPEGNTGYVPPGTAVPEASERLKRTLNSTESIIDGPSRDRWGVWMTGVAPIIDPKTGETVAVVGVSTSAMSYYTQIFLYALVPLLLAAIPFAGLVRDMKIQSKESEILHLKNQFVSIASHELRSPLTGILWAIQSLSKSGADRLNLEQLSMLGDMYHSVESSLATVNEILDMSIFDRGQAAKLQHEMVEIPAVLRQVVNTLKLGAHEKKLSIDAIDTWARQVFTYGDAAALKRAFMNIFSNAIKYSPDNSRIDITYAANDVYHIIGVRDNGIGIPPAEQEKVLEGYYRATNATAVEMHGTGLGLWVTRKIIEQHGGKLQLDSRLNQGTTVLVYLPIAAPPQRDGNKDAPLIPGPSVPAA